MNIYRTDGVKLTKGEKAFIADTVSGTISCPKAVSFDNIKLGDTIKLKAGFINSDEYRCNCVAILEFDEEETLDIMLENNRWKFICAICYAYKKIWLDINDGKKAVEWYKLTESVRYSGITGIIQTWKTLSQDNDSSIIPCPNDYDALENEFSAKAVGQLQTIWAMAVYKFGDYLGSPNYGFIYANKFDDFCDWCDIICFHNLFDEYDRAVVTMYNKPIEIKGEIILL